MVVINDCPADKVFDNTTCACICKEVITNCPANHAFSKETCKCECQTQSCSPGKALNSQSCLCECVPAQCPVSKRQDMDSCGCVPHECDPLNPKCPNFFVGGVQWVSQPDNSSWLDGGYELDVRKDTKPPYDWIKPEGGADGDLCTFE